MSENIKRKPPKWFWIVSALALIWNLMGVMAFVMQVTMSAEDMATMPDAERILYETTPMWATVAFAVAVFGGTIGCIFLVLRKKWATSMLMASLAGIIVQMIHSFFISNSFEVFDPGSAIMPIMVLMIAILLIWLAQSATKKGWIS